MRDSLHAPPDGNASPSQGEGGREAAGEGESGPNPHPALSLRGRGVCAPQRKHQRVAHSNSGQKARHARGGIRLLAELSRHTVPRSVSGALRADRASVRLCAQTHTCHKSPRPARPCPAATDLAAIMHDALDTPRCRLTHPATSFPLLFPATPRAGSDCSATSSAGSTRVVTPSPMASGAPNSRGSERRLRS